MTRNKTTRPTETELEILRVLWSHGPSSVRSIHNVLNRERNFEVGYSTTLKMCQVMHQKGLLDRDANERPQIYSTHLAMEETQRQLVMHLLERAFGGSARQLVMHALPTDKASEAELEELEKLLDKFEAGEK